VHGHITSLAVARTHRKLGLATKLMAAAREHRVDWCYSRLCSAPIAAQLEHPRLVSQPALSFLLQQTPACLPNSIPAAPGVQTGPWRKCLELTTARCTSA
jgi:GNAT superfamily N-acetyltransferase